MSRARAWTITVNNYTNQDLIDWYEADASYAIFGFEVGKKNGTPHMQGYMYFKDKITENGLKKLMPRCWCEMSRGSTKQNIEYCTKQEQWYEYGIRPKQGNRVDLTGMVEAIQEGATDLELIDLNPTNFIRYGKGLSAVRAALQKDRCPDVAPTVEWIYGPTGSGKTRDATERGEFYIKDSTIWWDGYRQQPIIIIDDFDGLWHGKREGWRDLLRVLDRYPYQGQVKGGYVKINSPTIIITSDKRPEVCFKWLKPNELSQLMRRFSRIIEKCPEVSGNIRASALALTDLISILPDFIEDDPQEDSIEHRETRICMCGNPDYHTHG